MPVPRFESGEGIDLSAIYDGANHVTDPDLIADIVEVASEVAGIRSESGLDTGVIAVMDQVDPEEVI